MPQNLFKIKVQECKKSTWLLTCVAQKRRCLRFSRPENDDRKWNLFTSHEGNFQHHLFVYSLYGALIKIARVCHMRWRNYFDGTNPHFLPPKQTFLGVRHAFLPYSCRAGTRDANVCVGGYPISGKGQKVSSCVFLSRLLQAFHI